MWWGEQRSVCVVGGGEEGGRGGGMRARALWREKHDTPNGECGAFISVILCLAAGDRVTRSTRGVTVRVES